MITHDRRRPGSGGSGGARTSARRAGSDDAGGPARRSPGLTDEQAAAWRALGDRRRSRCGSRDSMAATASPPITASDRTTGSSAPSLSATGGALLANDPHLGISMPSIWFINGLHCASVDAACPYDVAGVSFPGVPGVVLGHNARIAWGATNVDPDVQDLVIETVDPADPARYIGPDGISQPSTTRTETIAVSGADPVTMTSARRPRPDPQRRRQPARRRTADGPALDRDPPRCRAGPHARGRPRAQRCGRLRRLPRRAVDLRRPRRTSSTPTSTATSATSCRARSRSAPIPTTTALRPVRATTAPASGRAHPVRRPAAAAGSGRAGSSPRTTPRSMRMAGLHRRRVGSGYRAERIIDLSASTARTGIDLERDGVGPDRHGAASRARYRRFRLDRSTRRRRRTAWPSHDAILDWDGACTPTASAARPI